MMIRAINVVATCPSRSSCSVAKNNRDDGARRVTSGKLFSHYHSFFVLGLLVLFFLPKNAIAYYVGPEVGKAPGETRSTRAFGFGTPNNTTSLAEAAYVPYVYSVGNNVVTFLRSIIPALQPKVDFFAEQIQDTIDIANEKLMQKLENSNNGIIAAENFFTGLMKAFVFGKGPDDEERRRRLAVALINSGMLKITTPETPSATENEPTVSTTRRISTSPTTAYTSTVLPPSTVSSTLATTSSTSTTTTTAGTTTTTTQDVVSKPTMAAQKARDNNFNKMKVIDIVKNML